MKQQKLNTIVLSTSGLLCLMAVIGISQSATKDTNNLLPVVYTSNDGKEVTSIQTPKQTATVAKPRSEKLLKASSSLKLSSASNDPVLQAALLQSQSLMNYFQERNGDLSEVDDTFFTLQRLENTTNSTYPVNADIGYFCIPDTDDPDTQEIYFYSDAFAEFVVLRNADGEATGAVEEGTYIVGFRNGTVTTVPAAEVRYIRKPDDTFIVLFPGMERYNEGVPLNDR